MKNTDIVKQNNAAFIDSVIDKRERRRDEITNKRKRVGTLRTVTYAFQVLSFLTATYAIYHYTRDYSGLYIVLVWIVGALLLALIEAAKRYSILETSQGYYNPEDSHKTKLAALIVISIAISAAVSYHGGSKFVIEESNAPALVHNGQIDSISNLIALQEKTKAELATSKWKGALTRNARDGINQSNGVIASLMKEQSRLRQNDEITNTAIITKSDNKFTAFGYIFGGFAAFLDLLLLLCLFWAEKDETDVARFAETNRNVAPQRNAATQPQPQRNAPPPHGLRAVSNGVSEDLVMNRVTAQNVALANRLEELSAIVADTQRNAATPQPQRNETKRNAVNSDDALLLEEQLGKARNNLRAYKSKLQNKQGNKETLIAGIKKWEGVINEIETQLQKI